MGIYSWIDAAKASSSAFHPPLEAWHSYYAQPHIVAHTLAAQAQPLETYIGGGIHKKIAQFLFWKNNNEL